jgi:type I restriction enzyme S subunit
MVPSGSVVIALAGQGKTRGQVARTRIDLCTNQSLCSVIPTEKLNSDFLYHFLAGQYKNLRNASSGDGSRGGLNLEILRGYLVPLPDLELQKKIAAQLDEFDDLISDVTGSLPMEIAARRKQYEYYREKLLTFKELQSS